MGVPIVLVIAVSVGPLGLVVRNDVNVDEDATSSAVTDDRIDMMKGFRVSHNDPDQEKLFLGKYKWQFKSSVPGHYIFEIKKEDLKPSSKAGRAIFFVKKGEKC